MDAIRPDEPQAGFYTLALVRGGPQVPIRLWYGLPEIDGEQQDRSPRWCVEIDGRTTRTIDTGVTELLDAERVWPWCAKRPIDEEEYRFLVNKARWAKAHAPDRPEATPNERVDFMKIKTPF